MALFATTLEPGRGGVARVARLVARALARRRREGRIDASVCSLLDERPPSGLGLPARACAGSRALFVASFVQAAWKRSHFLYDCLGMARVHRRWPGMGGASSLTFVNGVEVWEQARAPRLAAARRVDTLVAISEFTRRRAQQLHGGFERAEVCWPATEDDDEPPRLSTPEVPRALMVSRVEEAYKGHGLLVDVWPRIVDLVPEARLTFAGHGSGLEALRRKIADSPARDRIEALGFVSEEDLQRLYGRSSVFVMPSRGEGFGLVYIEAMRYGLPVVATVHDAASEVNVDGETGYNVDLDRPEELPRRLAELLADPETARDMGERGRQRWRQHFRYSAFERRFLELLDVFLAKNPSGRGIS